MSAPADSSEHILLSFASDLWPLLKIKNYIGLLCSYFEIYLHVDVKAELM